MGRHTKHGGFVVEWTKVRTFVVPELEGFHMTPFVSKRIEKPKRQFAPEDGGKDGDWKLGPLSGKRWVEAWKQNGKDRPEVQMVEGEEVVLGR